MSAIKVNRQPRAGDVPAPLVAGVLALLVATFLPMAQRTPVFPTELPVLRDAPGAVRDAHRADLARPAPPATPQVLAAWRALSEVTARRDEAGFVTAQRLFATRLAEATLHARDAERAIAARALQAFLDAAHRGDATDATVRLAARHRLAGPDAAPAASDAARTAWFLMRWERMALPTPDRGEVEPLLDTLGRLPRPMQVAFAAWALRATCAEILGDGGRRGVRGARDCARLRRDMVGVAHGADPRYPTDEALAATDMLLAAGLLRHVDPARRVLLRTPEEPDETSLRQARDEAAEALQRALLRYEQRAGRGRRRLLERHQMAALETLASLP
ncbi:MAG: hypothetical protein U0325_18280 [Polyangiales bacterium]